jgi:hypothetical protein
MMDAHAELTSLHRVALGAANVFAFFDRKMSSSFRNRRKAGLLETAVKRSAASAAITERP